MKIRTLGLVVVLGAIGVNLIAPGVVNGVAVDALNYNSDGTIILTEDDGKTPNVPVDPENPDVDIELPTDVVVNPNVGLLKVDVVTNLDFGTQTATTRNKVFPAAAIATKDSTGAAVTRGNWVQITDARITARTKWKLTAKMSQQFTATRAETDKTKANVLNGAEITYANGLMASATDETLSPRPAFGGSTFKLSVDKTTGGNTVDIASTAAVADGYGTYTFEYGQSDAYTGTAGKKGTAGNSVNLSLPGSTFKTKETYKAKVLWTVAVVPE